jgi:hypothetical protein
MRKKKHKQGNFLISFPEGCTQDIILLEKKENGRMERKKRHQVQLHIRNLHEENSPTHFAFKSYNIKPSKKKKTSQKWYERRVM